jgi:hypothetical protein
MIVFLIVFNFFEEKGLLTALYGKGVSTTLTLWLAIVSLLLLLSIDALDDSDRDGVGNGVMSVLFGIYSCLFATL